MADPTAPATGSADASRQPETRRRHLTISVRDLVEFTLKTGNLGGERQFVSPTRALDGTRGHQRIQRTRPDGYQAEVALSHEIITETFTLTIKGRVDGILVAEDSIVIEEIKTIAGGWDGCAHPLHWAQAKLYALFYLHRAAGEEDPRKLATIDVQLTYLDLDTDHVSSFRETFSADQLERFYETVARPYLDWIRAQVEWWNVRDASIRKVPFPFNAYRPGQRELAVAAYRALQRGVNLFAEAPTGIGKTISVVFPSVKALAERIVTKIFYATAKTPGRTIAEQAVAELRRSGARIRSVTLTAREKVCVIDGARCDPATCPRAIGYYDRYKAAVTAGCNVETLTRTEVERLATEFQVCPFALALDLAPWADLIICDYNHVFDPKVYLRQFLDERNDHALLVDEAHNLADRAREMFSAELVRADLTESKKAIAESVPACAKAIDKIIRSWARLPEADSASTELPKSLLPHLARFVAEAEKSLIQQQAGPAHEILLNLYFNIAGFLRTTEIFDVNFRTIHAHGRERIRLFCVDPALLIQKALDRVRSTIFFSATLRPAEYFRALYGWSDTDLQLQLPSPFPPQNFQVLLAGRVGTQFKERAKTRQQVCEAIAAMVQVRPGNYLIYFPSHQYLADLAGPFQALCPEVEFLAQSPRMTDAERDTFLGRFTVANGRTLVGFAVLGGIFGEGIDLQGERLVGAAVVGVGLPQLCLERDLIRDHYNAKGLGGFDYAYVLPGIQRVLQAVGRVIRSETDRGIALLVDTRFAQQRYRELLPPWWTPVAVSDAGQIHQAAASFWRGDGYFLAES